MLINNDGLNWRRFLALMVIYGGMFALFFS